MLKRALLYKDRVQEELIKTWDNLKYQYYWGEYCNLDNIDDNNWDNDQYVSVCEETDEICGYICVKHRRYANQVSSIYFTGFSNKSKNNAILLKDVREVVHNCFYKYNYDRVCFGVYVGNPIEKYYDSLVATSGGRVCSYKRKSTRGLQGQLLDFKEYEILIEEYKEHIREDMSSVNEKSLKLKIAEQINYN